MALDSVKNFAFSTVATAPSPPASGLSLIVATGEGALFPDPAADGAFNVVVRPIGEAATSVNAEILRVTARAGDTFTISRQQEGSSARTVLVGDYIALTMTKKLRDDINSYLVPVGGIIMWAGTIANIPSGWALCTGIGGTPDLRDMFVVGAAVGADAGATGGASSYTLTMAQMPSHSHAKGTLATANDTHNHTIGIRNNYGSQVDRAGGAWTGTNSTYDSGNDTHSHTVTGSTASAGSGNSIDNRPAFYAVF